MRKTSKFAPLMLGVFVGLFTTWQVMADDAGEIRKSGILDLLLKQTGVYDRSKTGKTPEFVSDPTWPLPLPHSWLLGQIGGLYVDRHDHVWVYNRPRTMNDDEVGLEKALPGETDAKGQPINALGFVRVNGFGADCCRAAPAVLEFDASGKLLRAWGAHPTRAFSVANARPKMVASGRTASTASMSTRRTMSGSPAMLPHPSPAPNKSRGPPTRREATVLS
jgi:hypothetical protein